MNKLPFLLLSLCMFFSCKLLKQSNNESQSDSGFSDEDIVYMKKTYGEFVRSLPVISLPLTIQCNNLVPIRDSELLEKTKWFTPSGYNLVGRIETNKDFYLILCTLKDQSNYPVMYSVTSTGKTIALTKLFDETCRSDSLEELYVQTNILSAERIVIWDSTIYHLKRHGLFIDSILVGADTLSLQKDGVYTK